MTATDASRPSFWRRAWAFALEIWGVLRRPSSVFSLGILVLAGFVAGILFWGAFNTALELTNTETFCMSCHEMRTNVFEELKTTVHYSNRSGVRAHCPDCHVPHEWTHKIARKMQASKEVWGKIFGTIDTREKFVEHRLQLAMHEWARMKANDSLECRNCHSADSMDITRQSPRAVELAPALPVYGPENLHRLSQGHRASLAGHAQRPRMAIAAPIEGRRLTPSRSRVQLQ